MVENQRSEKKSPGHRKKLERSLWRESGGAFKEIKFTRSGVERLKSGRERRGFDKDWEYIDFLLKHDGQ